MTITSKSMSASSSRAIEKVGNDRIHVARRILSIDAVDVTVPVNQVTLVAVTIHAPQGLDGQFGALGQEALILRAMYETDRHGESIHVRHVRVLTVEVHELSFIREPL